ncbi:reverse transcriptase domain-containing protein [Tanacetum coccineum]
MNKFMKILPTLIALMNGDALTMYLTSSTESIGATLFVERDERQLLIYFAYTITVLTNAPIKQTFSNLEKSGRVAKWAIELGEHDIELRERNNTKKEVSKDFLVELPFEEDKKKPVGSTETKLESTQLSNAWKLYIDRASSSDGSGAGLMLTNLEGKKYTYALRFKFETTNNKAEYEALLAGLQIAKEM